MDLFDLSAKITLDSSEYEKGLSNAAASAKGFGGKLSSAMKVGAAAVAATAAAVVALTGAIVGAVGKTAEYGDTIDKQSQKMGLSAQAYQEWDAILQHSGTSIDSMTRGMVTLSRQAESNSAAFEKLGISQQELATLNQEELFSRTIEGLQGMEAGTERTALAQELLGGSAKELGALLNTSAEDTEKMRQRVHELGGVMSDEAVKAAAAYQDSLQDMKTAISGASRALSADFMPSLTLIMDGLTEIFSGGDGMAQITDGVNQFIQKMNAAIPKVVQVGGQIIIQLADAIIANLPALLQAAVPVILTLANGIIENLPMIVEAALQIILELANGISESLPTLIPVIVDVVLQIVETLIDNVDLLVEAAVQIIVALTEGLIAATPKLVEKAPEIILKFQAALIQAIPTLLQAGVQITAMIQQGIASVIGQLLAKGRDVVVNVARGIAGAAGQLVAKGRELVTRVGNGIRGALSSAASWGRDLVQNFVNGITSRLSSLASTVSNMASTIRSHLHFSEPDVGPLSDFHTYAPDMMELFAKGIRDNKKMLLDTVDDAFNFQDMIVSPTFGVNANGDIPGGDYGTSGVAIYGDVHITVDGTGKNAEEIGRDLYKMLIRQGATAYAY